MRIFSKRAFQFTQGDESIQVTSQAFNDVPDWVQKTQLFQLALKDSSITIAKDKAQSKQLENDGMPNEEKILREYAKSLGITQSNTTGLDKLKKKIKAKEEEIRLKEENENNDNNPDTQNTGE